MGRELGKEKERKDEKDVKKKNSRKVSYHNTKRHAIW